MGILFFWQWSPPDPEIPLLIWRAFLDTMAGWLIIWIDTGIVLTTTFYAVHARLKRIRVPNDVFAAYTPLNWLGLSLVPATLLFWFYRTEFLRSFPNARVSWIGGAVALAIVGGVLTVIVSYFLTWLPIVTPRKYHYRPRALLLAARYARRTFATQQ
jgi:hypothetical protein